MCEHEVWKDTSGISFDAQRSDGGSGSKTVIYIHCIDLLGTMSTWSVGSRRQNLVRWLCDTFTCIDRGDSQMFMIITTIKRIWWVTFDPERGGSSGFCNDSGHEDENEVKPAVVSMLETVKVYWSSVNLSWKPWINLPVEGNTVTPQRGWNPASILQSSLAKKRRKTIQQRRESLFSLLPICSVKERELRKEQCFS